MVYQQRYSQGRSQDPSQAAFPCPCLQNQQTVVCQQQLINKLIFSNAKAKYTGIKIGCFCVSISENEIFVAIIRFILGLTFSNDIHGIYSTVGKLLSLTSQIFLLLQVLAVNHGEERKVELTEDGARREDERGFPTSLLRGEYDEEESARSFQEALRQWRREKSDGAGEPRSEEAMWIPVRPGELHRHVFRDTEIHTHNGTTRFNALVGKRPQSH